MRGWEREIWGGGDWGGGERGGVALSAGRGSGAPAGRGCHRRRGCPRGRPWDAARGVVWRSSGSGELWANGAWEIRESWGGVGERKKEKK